MKHLYTLLLCLLLTACTAGEAPEDAPADTPAATLETLCGADYQAYLSETVIMQMENRMDKAPSVVYFPIEDGAPLVDYAAIDETTDFQLDGEGNILLSFPAGSVADAAHGPQSFRIPCP